MAFLDRIGLRRYPGTILPAAPDALYIEGSPYSVRMVCTIPDNCYILAHVPSNYQLDGFRVISVRRDPRNVLVSYCRHRKQWDELDFSIPHALNDFWGLGFVNVYRSYLGWKDRALSIRYEDMPPSVVGDGNGIYANHPHDWNTRTGSPSDWRQAWDEEAAKAWTDHGGPELLAEAGYEP